MSQSNSFLHKVFCDISLEKDPDLWQDAEDSEEKNIKRIRLIAEFSKTMYTAQLSKDKSTARKNDALSKAMKDKGNSSYGSSDILSALQQYNQALMFASKDSDMALIYANRSALWFELGEHELVAEDIQRALRCGYPDNLQHKLYDRRAKSRFAQKKLDLAKEDLKLCLKYLPLSKLSQDKVDAKTTEINGILAKIGKSNTKASKENEVDTKLSKSPEMKNPNAKFPTFSDAVQITYKKGQGRFATAARDIEVGELIAAETAFVSCLDKEFCKTNCWHCLRLTKNPVPCMKCSGMVYCSEKCRDISDNSYHKYECLYTDVLYQANLGAWRLAYRAMTAYPWDFFKENKEKFLSRNELAGVKGETVYTSQDIYSFHNLVTHDGLAGKQAPELMMQCHVVVFFIRLMNANGYLPKPDNKHDLQLSEDQLLAARILHHLMRAAFFNTHEITQIEKKGEKYDSIRVERIGRVTNPSLALINHSCDPNYRRVSSGTTTYGFACKPIRKGEEISDLYGKPFSSSPMQDRQKGLQKYNFSCLCRACKENWQTMEALPNQIENLPIKFYSLPQNRIANQVQRVNRCEDILKKLVQKDDISDANIINAISTIVNENYKLLRAPHNSLVYWENQLHQALHNAYSSKVFQKTENFTTIMWPA